MYIKARKNISIKMSSMKKKRNRKRKRYKEKVKKKERKRKGKKRKKIIIKMMAFDTNDLEMVVKKDILVQPIHPFDMIRL